MNGDFLTDLMLKGLTIIIDKTKFKYPGDLLHEGGYIAVTDKEKDPSNYKVNGSF